MEVNGKLLNIFKFTELENGYKISYLGNEPVDLAISVILKGLDLPAQTIRFVFEGRGQWFIPGLDYTGCKILELRERLTNKLLVSKIISPRLSKKNKKQNIVCIGLNKTGTSSFVYSLQKLGFNLANEVKVFSTCVPDVYHGDFNSTFSILENERYNLFDDMPFSFPKFYKHLYKKRPDDVYVLTIRKNVETWVKSVINFYPLLKYGTKNNWEDKSFFHLLLPNEDYRFFINQETQLFDAWNLENDENLEVKLTNIYNQHLEEVKNFFSQNPSNFIILDVSVKGELKKFCDWLGIESKQDDFDWINKKSQ